MGSLRVTKGSHRLTEGRTGLFSSHKVGVKFSRVINWILCLTSVLLFFLGRCFVSEEECSSLAAEVKHAARRGS